MNKILKAKLAKQSPEVRKMYYDAVASPEQWLKNPEVKRRMDVFLALTKGPVDSWDYDVTVLARKMNHFKKAGDVAGFFKTLMEGDL
jgi:hypothetical protein